MQKITRVHLANCGYRTAWYEGLTFDLTDPNNGEPTDTVINLENGGGKTTLLGLIFSCFETSQERFLKHLQAKTASFSQYFTHDGVPGFILVEWLMPSRTAGGQPYRLVTGQAVAVRTTSDPPDVDRMFFSFEERADLSFKDIPAPGLTATTPGSMADFSRWLHALQKQHPGNVYLSHNRQAEWQRHLKDERLIDLDMLRIQLNFSAQEGGFDAGFLDFKTEPEFLRKFLHLTSDSEKADKARAMIVAVCEKHRRKPQLEKRRDELTKFRASLNAFADAARQYIEAFVNQRGLTIQGAQLVLALQARALVRHAQRETELEFERTQTGLAGAAAKEAALHTNELMAVTWAWHQKSVAVAKTRRDTANTAVATLERQEHHLKAGRLQKEILGIDQQIREQEALAEAHRADLKPARDHVDIQGALLRRALRTEETRLEGEFRTLDGRASARNERRTTLKSQKGTAEGTELRLTQEQSRLQTAEEACTRQRAALVQEGLLQDAQEPADEAAARHDTQASTHAAERDALRLSRDGHRAQSKQHRETASRERVAATEAREQAKSLSTYIASGEAEFERLSQLPALLSAVESDGVDPLSPVLEHRLTEVVADSARQISHSDVRLAGLHATRQAIETTGVAGHDPDVALVVQHLHLADVRSARAFNEYIARALPDAEHARALVLSDPARYAGVCVAQGELEKARGVVWGERRPTQPVTISVAALDVVAGKDDVVVVPAEDDSAFNVEAATRLGVSLGVRIEAEQQRRVAYEARYESTLKAGQELQTFGKTYGNGQLAEAAAKRDALLEDEAVASARADNLELEAGTLDERAAEDDRLAGLADGRYNQSRQAVKAVRTFQAEHEAGRPDRLHRLIQLDSDLEQARASKAEAEAGLDAVQVEHDADHARSVVVNHERSVLADELSKIAYYDKDYPAQEQLAQNPRPLSTLRDMYKDALDFYLTEEQNKLGLLSERMQNTQALRASKSAELVRDFPTVQAIDLEPYINVDHTVDLEGVALQLVAAKTEQLDAAAQFKVTYDAAAKWQSANKARIPPPVPGHEALEVPALAELMEQAERNVDEAHDRMRAANEEATRAGGRASVKLTEAKQDESTESMLRAGLDLPERPDPLLVAAQIGALIGTTPDVPDLETLVLELDASAQAKALLADHSTRNKGVTRLQTAARNSFEALKSAAAEPAFREVDEPVAQQMLQNDFNSACTDAERLLMHLDDRIATTQSTLDSMKKDFDACTEELLGVVRNAISTLTRAVSADKSVPAAAPYVGGKPVLKMRANFGSVPVDSRRQALDHYLNVLTDTNVFPARGTDLVADAVLRVYGKPLGLQVLKMSVEETEQYVSVDRISNSGGEGVVMAMFLFLLINQLRAENHAHVQRIAGGPLILDNPFAKATSPAMWRAQRLLAATMNVQLIFATAVQDYNAIGEFQRFIRLRKAGQNTKTRRWHLEIASFLLNETPDEVEA
jgi:hypothetical protein